MVEWMFGRPNASPLQLSTFITSDLMEVGNGRYVVDGSVSDLLIPCSLELPGGECERQENERELVADDGWWRGAVPRPP